MRNRADCNLFRNFIKYEQSSLNFLFIDEHNKAIGGKVQAHVKEFNISQFKTFDYHTFGFFNNEKIVLGKFKDSDNKFNNENALYDVTKANIENTDLISRESYEIDSHGLVYYKVEVNPMLSDLAHEDMENSHTELIPKGCLNFRELMWHNFP